MAKIWKPQTFETLSYWIDDIIEEASDRLNSWETTFVEDIKIKVDNKWPITQAQEEKLESIYTKYTS